MSPSPLVLAETPIIRQPLVLPEISGLSRNLSSPSRSAGLLPRVVYISLLFALELAVFSTWLDTATLTRNTGLTGLVGDWGPGVVRAAIAMVAAFMAFAHLKAKEPLRRISAELESTSISWRFLAAHICVLLAFAGLSTLLFTTNSYLARIDFLAGLWLAIGIVSVALGTCAFISPDILWRIARTTRVIGFYAFIAGILAYRIGNLAALLWKPSADVTFQLVKLGLRPLVHGLVADPSQRVIGTDRFIVAISPQCSGLEGAGLMLVFGLVWLWFFRQECPLPRGLLLIAAGIVAVWLLNVVRIGVLILIGNAGAPNVALGGFHSQAGWLAFNAVALGLILGVERIAHPNLQTAGQPRNVLAANPAAKYLMPFLTIVAAAMLSRAASGTFEWLYPLRFFAGAIALWCFRDSYKQLKWSFGWGSVVTGTAVFLIWIMLDRVMGTHADNGLHSAVLSLPVAGKIGWITSRALAAIVTVPIAEELAFRGFLLRRFISADVDSVGFRTTTVFSVILSSVAFGCLHGDRWLAGILAGVLYSLVIRWRGRIGDAVVAHATTNALLAAWVLLTDNWYFW